MNELRLPSPVCFVLGGGGSLGAMQVGMLRALTEHAVVPDLVAGTSVGSINGAVVALDPTLAATRLAAIWTSITRPQVFPGGRLAQLRTLLRYRTHLFDHDALAGVIARGLDGIAYFDELTLPFRVIAADAGTGQAVVLDSGLLVPAILASSAIPGIFPPVRHENRVLYDGGVLANVPIRQALAMGARSLVVLDCAFPGQLPTAPRTLPETLLFWAILSSRNQAVREAELAAEQVPVLYLPGPPVAAVGPLDFGHTATLIAGSYQAVSQFLDDLRVDGAGLYGHPYGQPVGIG